jgi:hypothetical protein
MFGITSELLNKDDTVYNMKTQGAADYMPEYLEAINILGDTGILKIKSDYFAAIMKNTPQGMSLNPAYIEAASKIGNTYWEVKDVPIYIADKITAPQLVRIDSSEPITRREVQTLFSVPVIPSVRSMVSDASNDAQQDKIQTANIMKPKFPLWLLLIPVGLYLMAKRGSNV